MPYHIFDHHRAGGTKILNTLLIIRNIIIYTYKQLDTSKRNINHGTLIKCNIILI